MIVFITILLIIIDFIVLLIDIHSAVYWRKEWIKSRHDSDLLKSLTSCVWTIVMVLCIILCGFSLIKIENGEKLGKSYNYSQKII